MIRHQVFWYSINLASRMISVFIHPLAVFLIAKLKLEVVESNMASSPPPFLLFLLLLVAPCCSRSAALPGVGGHPAVDATCPSVKLPPSALSPNYSGPKCQPTPPHVPVPVFPYDVDPTQFALNLEFTEAEFFLHAAFGEGLDKIAPELALGGPPPVGARKAKLDEVTWRVIAEFALQEVGHIRAIEKAVGGIPRPLIDLSAHNFAKVMDEAFGYSLDPPFDPYVDSINFLLACYVIPYLGINGYVGTNAVIDGYESKKLVAGLLGVEAGQDAVFRTLLFEHLGETVPPYKNITVAEFTDRVSALRNRLAGCGVKDEGLTVPRELGAERAICTNSLSADMDSLSYPRTPKELLRFLYRSGDEHVPGGFYPKGANGRIAQELLGKPRRHSY